MKFTLLLTVVVVATLFLNTADAKRKATKKPSRKNPDNGGGRPINLPDICNGGSLHCKCSNAPNPIPLERTLKIDDDDDSGGRVVAKFSGQVCPGSVTCHCDHPGIPLHPTSPPSSVSDSGSGEGSGSGDDSGSEQDDNKRKKTTKKPKKPKRG